MRPQPRACYAFVALIFVTVSNSWTKNNIAAFYASFPQVIFFTVSQLFFTRLRLTDSSLYMLLHCIATQSAAKHVHLEYFLIKINLTEFLQGLSLDMGRQCHNSYDQHVFDVTVKTKYAIKLTIPPLSTCDEMVIEEKCCTI